jgi:hypothetical protein
MARAPQDPREIFPGIIEDYKGLYGDDLISIILYGSATGGAYRPGKSDINFMIVLSETGIEDLDRAFDVVSKWRKRKVAVPLFLTEVYIGTSLDVFPIEYLNFQRNYVPVHGKDVLKGLSFEREHLRLQCEREIKGKLLLLREAYLETSGKAKALKEVISNSLPAFMAIFEALLFLREKEPAADRRELIRSMGTLFDIDAGIFEGLLDLREERVKPGDEGVRDLFRDYLKEVRKLSKSVDTMGG